MDVGQTSKLQRLVLRQRVAEKVSATDFRTGQIFQEVRLAQGRMKFDMEMKTPVIGSIGWSMMQRHHVRKWHAPEVVVPHEHDLQRLGKVTHFIRVQSV